MTTHKNNLQKSYRLALLVVPALFLSACSPINWIKDKLGINRPRITETTELFNDGSKVLATIDGKPLITEKTFTQAFDRILEDNPQLKQMLPIIPNLKNQFLISMVSQEVVNKYIMGKGIDRSKAYQDELEQIVRSAKSALNFKHFSKQFPLVVSDSDVQQFYNEHKQDIPELLLSAGGVKASGISSKSEAEAKQIAANVKGKSLAQVADTMGKKAQFRDFGLVTEKSTGIDAGLKSQIIALKKVPTVTVLKATDGSFWVVSATTLQEAQYQPFDKIKNELKAYLENKNTGEKINNEIERLKKEYNVVIIEDEVKDEKETGPQLAQASSLEGITEPSTAHVA